jgi:hypothetical protein
MNIKDQWIITIPLLAAILLSGCASSASQTVEVTVLVPQTIVVTQIVERVITTTPVPPTETPEPTPTLQASPTPAFQRWSSENALAAFHAAGLEAEGSRPMTRDDYGIAPLSAVEGTRFLIPSLCADCGGRILSFANQEDLELMRRFYEEMGRQSAAFFSWVFEKDNVLVQINGDLPESRAREYEAALENME